mmetsp:Transcript_53449/g.134338  ORF Transcript_53449/g.134338 Transcript_53449/m.134338 type:complete len:205 (+) Transcript_53449:162-776(+)
MDNTHARKWARAFSILICDAGEERLRLDAVGVGSRSFITSSCSCVPDASRACHLDSREGTKRSKEGGSDRTLHIRAGGGKRMENIMGRNANASWCSGRRFSSRPLASSRKDLRIFGQPSHSASSSIQHTAWSAESHSSVRVRRVENDTVAVKKFARDRRAACSTRATWHGIMLLHAACRKGRLPHTVAAVLDRRPASTGSSASG